MLARSRVAKTYPGIGREAGRGWRPSRPPIQGRIEFQHAKSLQLWGKWSFLSQTPLSGTSPPMHSCVGAQKRKRNSKRKKRKKPSLRHDLLSLESTGSSLLRRFHLAFSLALSTPNLGTGFLCPASQAQNQFQGPSKMSMS